MIKENLQVDCIITSPPYWNLRDYGIKPSIWDGDPDCEHEFGEWKNEKNIREYKIYDKEWERPSRKEFNKVSSKTKCIVCKKEFDGKIGQKFCSIKCLNTLSNKDRTNSIPEQQFCSKCGAWLGTLGLEPNFELYIKHLCDIYDLVWQGLKPTGTNWVNLGDTYSSGGRSGSKEYFEKGHKQFGKNDPKGKYQAPKKVEGFPSKCLLMLPQRFAIEMINRGWILRNVIIWHKPNAMPSSARDRFTVDFEYVFFFVKSNKTQYWINEKTTQLVSKKPLGRKGIENIDWEWRECSKCLGTGIKHKKCKHCKEEGWVYNTLLQPEKCPSCKGLGRIKQDKECKSCKGKGIKKYNFWRGRQYWFEQQLEPYDKPLNRWGGNKYSTQTLEKSKYNDVSPNIDNMMRASHRMRSNSLGKNKRTVWEIPTQPNPVSHFAVFPPTLIEPMILSGCPEFVCNECGKPREKIFGLVHNKKKGKKASDFAKENIKKGQAFDKSQFSARCYPTDRSCGNPLPRIYKGYSDCGCFDHIKYSKAGLNLSNTSTILTKEVQPKEFKGYSDCIHGSKWKPGIVLDPFAGVGTTLYQAWRLGRNYIGFEISKEYCEIAENQLSKTRFKRLDAFIYSENGKIEV